MGEKGKGYSTDLKRKSKFLLQQFINLITKYMVGWSGRKLLSIEAELPKTL